MSDLRGEPYLSIVIPSRNDDHGGNMLRRMQLSLNGLFEQLEKYRIESELILVEWNPPVDRPLLRDAIKWRSGLKYCTIRAIVVPSSIHRRYEHSDKTEMNAVVGVNCGIRRARGQFILPSTMDILRSDELMSYLASKKLKTDERYRIDRCDVNRNVLNISTLQEKLDYCQKNIIFVKAHKPKPRRRFPWFGDNLPNLHTSACGDFQLMSRQLWHLLRGYREADIPSAYSDSLLSYASYAAGVREVVLKAPMHLYHIDHDGKFTESIEEVKLPFENWLSFPILPKWLNKIIVRLYRIFLRLIGYEFKSIQHRIPTLHYTESRRIARDMIAGKRPYIFNDDNWGLGQDSLEEFVISTADWDKGYGKN